MRRQDAWRNRRPGHRLAGLALLVLLLAAAASLAGGVFFLWRHFRDPQPAVFRQAAGWSLVLSALLQARCLWRACTRCNQVGGWESARLRPLVRWMSAGFVLCYALGLVLGPAGGAPYAFVAALAWWHVAVLGALTADASLLDRVASLLRRRPARWAGWTVWAVAMSVLAAELGLRVYALVADDPLPETFVARRCNMTPGAQYGGRPVNALGYWDEEFRRQPTPGVRRVAVLGDGMTLSGTTQENCLTLLERLLPGAEVYHFGIRGAGLREYAAQLFHEVAEYHPDLVLVFVSIDDDVTRQIPLPDTFDWQGLRLYQMALRLWADETPPATGPVAETDDSTCRRDYLRRASSRLAVCRAPIDQPTHEAWNRAQGHLARLIDTCRRGDMDVALVLLPADFQVNAALCESMRMRMGYQRCQLDLEIPQRRLREFAARQQVAVLDLLPHFRAADAPLYVRHDRHWNTAGNATAARIIGSWLTARYSVQPTTIVRAE